MCTMPMSTSGGAVVMRSSFRSADGLFASLQQVAQERGAVGARSVSSENMVGPEWEHLVAHHTEDGEGFVPVAPAAVQDIGSAFESHVAGEGHALAGKIDHIDYRI